MAHRCHAETRWLIDATPIHDGLYRFYATLSSSAYHHVRRARSRVLRQLAAFPLDSSGLLHYLMGALYKKHFCVYLPVLCCGFLSRLSFPRPENPIQNQHVPGGATAAAPTLFYSCPPSKTSIPPTVQRQRRILSGFELTMEEVHIPRPRTCAATREEIKIARVIV